MPEFTAVSSADPAALVNDLNQHASSGWEVVSVVESGGRVHAILRREGNPPAAAAAAPAAAAAAPAAAVAPAAAAEPVAAAPAAVTPIETAQPVTAAAASTPS